MADNDITTKQVETPEQVEPPIEGASASKKGATTAPKKEIETLIEVEITDFVKFANGDKIVQWKKGERQKVTKELKDILIIRGVCRVL